MLIEEQKAKFWGSFVQVKIDGHHSTDHFFHCRFRIQHIHSNGYWHYATIQLEAIFRRSFTRFYELYLKDNLSVFM